MRCPALLTGSLVLILVIAGLPVATPAAPVIIEGAPQTGWSVGHFSQTIDALYSGLAALGCPISYDELMVASGAAFRTAWWPGYYSYLGQEATPEDVLVIGAEAAGGGAEHVDHTSVEDAWTTACGSLDEGFPVLARRGAGFRLICGYNAQGQMMYVRDYNCKSAAYDVMPFEAPEPPWPMKGGHDVVRLSYDRQAKPPALDWPAILDRAVRFADWPPQQKVYGIYVFGLGAYDQWADTMRRGPDRNGVETDVELLEYMAQTMVETRSCASVVLEANAKVHDSFGEAANLYMEEATLFTDFLAALHGEPRADRAAIVQSMVANFGLPENREKLAGIVEQAKMIESEAVDALRVALKDLQAKGNEPAPRPVVTEVQPAPVVAEPPQPPVEDKTELAKAHCAKGRELKAAGQPEEAAAELRKAIEADPKLVEAHWVLGWVLIDLKDKEAAKAEFRKVIELAPDTDQAKEAQKALERLGG